MQQAGIGDYWIGVGDIHQQVDRLASIPGVAQARGIILSGDLTNRGGEKEAARILAAARKANPNVLAQIGNMDMPIVTGLLQREGINLHCAARVLDSEYPALGVMGVGASTFTPFGTPSEVSEERLQHWLETTYEQARTFRHLLVVIHNPPKDTQADTIGGGVHVGSPAVRAFLERVQPDVCLTGHIHESACEDRLGRTILINPGALDAGGYARIDLRPGGFTARLLQQ
ncbi:metallophosphoesterase [Megalodesulfovibrio gigas]|nr:metallophosphoesterase [Megalodesulfovibrio gigas]